MSLALACPTCTAAMQPGDRFCERCGSSLSAAPCRLCGARVDGDGYCTRCGVREYAPSARSELDVTIAAGVSDQGRARAANEDALHLEAVGDAIAAVVCDGISSSERSAEAAVVAATEAGTLLAAALRSGCTDLAEVMSGAIGAAQRAVAGLRSAPPADPPACTIVAAVCREASLTVGWAGDSRAYWISAGDGRLLTADDSWAAEQVAAGLVTAAEAGVATDAHAVTRWLGADAPDEPPHVASVVVDGGRLVLCTDGFWNCMPAAGDLARLASDHASPLEAARALVDHALAAGGRDNITAIVVNIPPAWRAAA